MVNGTWRSPGSFLTSGVLGAPVSNSIAQLLVPTSVISFAGYVVKLANGAYDVRWPFLPVGVAACAGTELAASFNFQGSTLSQSSAALGKGVPGTNQVRSLRGFDNATTSVATSATAIIGASSFTANCTVTRQLNTASFACGGDG
jgi:hypothetical protein